MIEAQLPADEELRLEALRSCAILDTAPEDAFDQITWLASYICGVPMALVSMVDAERQWFKSRRGLDASETPRRVAFCSHAILGDDVLVVEDARADARFHDNPLVSGPPHIRFYAGAPLTLGDGHRIGTLCVIDREARTLEEPQLQALRALASQVVAQLELRRNLAMLAATNDQLAAQRAELAKHAQLLELAHTAIIVSDLENVIRFWNRGAEEMYGWSRKEVVGRKADEVLHTKFPVAYDVVEDALMRQGKWRGELTHTMRDGHEIIVSSRWALQRGDGGEPLAILEINNDITPRKVAENALRASEARLQSIWNNALSGLITVNPEGLILSFNPAAEKIFGYSAEEVVGRDMALLVPDAECDARSFFDELLPNAIGRITECRAKRKNGEAFPLELALFEITSEEREFACAVVDLSERHAVEQMKNDFIATVSHELRTPLTSIRGALGLLAGGVMGAIPEEAAKLVAVAERNSVRLIQLINDILDIERLDSGSVEMHSQTTSLTAVIDRAVESVRAFADTQGVAIDVELDDRSIDCDPDRIVQVLVNLLSNAVKFSVAPSRVEISAAALNGWTEIRVRDHGRGIPEESIPKLFQRFRQVEAGDARDKGGTGLGLAISKAIVEKHRGMIGVESREGEGTLFWFRLPHER